MSGDEKGSTTSGLGDLFGLLGGFGGANPLSGVAKSVTQFQRGVHDLVDAIERLNATIEHLHQVTERLSVVLDELNPLPARRTPTTRKAPTRKPTPPRS